MAKARIHKIITENWGFRVNTIPKLTEIVRKLEKTEKALKGVALLAARHEAEYELALTQEQVPVKTGELKASGRVEGPDSSQKWLMANIYYGGPAGAGQNTVMVDYALAVHEDLYAFHPHGKAKYVEDPVRAERESGRMVERMAAEIKSRMGWA